jgi:hypothetical protein
MNSLSTHYTDLDLSATNPTPYHTITYTAFHSKPANILKIRQRLSHIGMALAAAVT